jgi:hypothetical protein
MISIIICSKDSTFLRAVSDNVAATIGLPHEIIAIDNSQGQMGICAAYNAGAGRSKFDLLCFMHEDIQVHTSGWGMVVADILADRSIGLLGVTGSHYLVDAPAPWWGGGLNLCKRNVLERHADNNRERVLQNPDQESLSDVVAVDGLWLCTRKEVWRENRFDEQNFPFFHFYDLDFSAQVVQKYRVCVTFDILIEHFSRGQFNEDWVRSALAFVRKWQDKLPMRNVSVSKAQQRQIKMRALQAFVSRLLSVGYSRGAMLKYVLQSLLHSPFDRDNLWLLKQIVLRIAGGNQLEAKKQ